MNTAPTVLRHHLGVLCQHLGEDRQNLVKFYLWLRDGFQQRRTDSNGLYPLCASCFIIDDDKTAA